MKNCNDCGASLKQLLGRHFYCPNDCDKKPKAKGPRDGYIFDHITSTSWQNIDFSGRNISGNLKYYSCKILTDKDTIVKGVEFDNCFIEGEGHFDDCTFNRCSPP